MQNIISSSCKSKQHTHLHVFFPTDYANIDREYSIKEAWFLHCYSKPLSDLIEVMMEMIAIGKNKRLIKDPEFISERHLS